MAVNINSQDRIEGAKNVDLGAGQGTMTPTRIVIHYSGGSTLDSAVNTLKARRLSYNVLIDTDGSYHQARPFNKSSSHAGRSNWKANGQLTNKSSLNASAIGISLVNLGRFDFFRGGKWHWGWHNGEPTGPSIADAEANKHALIYQPGRRVHWTPYDPRQIQACNALVAALVNKYPSITEIVGHHDIAIDDKPDPGPLYPLETLRRDLGMQGGLGLETKVNSPDGEVNLRDRPGIDGRVLKVLRNGDILHIRSVTYTGPSRGLIPSDGRTLTGWASVDIDGSNTHGGFVYMKYVTKTPLADEYAARL